jgi:peptide/nickel transport system substrate-binding protein
VPQSDLTILDPIFSTAYITRSHGYLVYDTLFGMDAHGKISPQMVGAYQISDDNKTWSFTLRDGLEFHDATPVTSEDVIASLQRWGQKDAMGQRLLSFVATWEVVDSKTFRMNLKAPYGLVLESLGKPDSGVPFIMPKRLASQPASKTIDDPTGSGPFILKQDESRPGEKVVYVRNPKYRPRLEPASGTAGGKVAKLDRVEWIIIKDPQTQSNALVAAEVDMIANPAFEQYALLKRNPEIQFSDSTPFISQFELLFNHLQPPFDKPKVRRAAMASLSQAPFLQTQVGNPDMYRTCLSVYACDSPYATSAGMDPVAHASPQLGAQLLKESGYGGETVVILHPTDLAVIARLPAVAADLLRKAGFKVEMQSMDWNTVSSRRNKKDGWNIFITGSNSVALMNPVTSNLMSGAGYPKAFYGWPSDSRIETLREAFAAATAEPERKALAEEVQKRAMEVGIYVPLGEFRTLVASRRNVKGMVPGYFLVFWNLEKQ